MSLGENIYFSILGLFITVLLLLVWIVFRKTIKIPIVFSIIVMSGFISYFIYYQGQKEVQHEKVFEQVTAYLEETFPNRTFTVKPAHYEKGQPVGEFYVYDTETPKIGVTFYVDKKEKVTQTSWWSNDSPLPHVTKEDELIRGEQTVFALTIDGAPAIAIFSYSKEGVQLITLQKNERDDFIVVEENGERFIYIQAQYEEEKLPIHLENGQKHLLTIDGRKGQLIVEDLQ